MVYLFGILIGFLCERVGKKYGSFWPIRKMPAFLFYSLMPCLLTQIWALRVVFGDDPRRFDFGNQVLYLGMYASMVPVALAAAMLLHSYYGVLRAKDAADRAEEEAMQHKNGDIPYR